jgi:hypothetical protein
MTTFWIVFWVVAIAVLAVLVVRERRSGRKIAPDAVQRRRESTFRMENGASHLQSRMPDKAPDRE